MTTTHEIPRSINYDAASGDFAMYLDGELIGFARSYSEAEITLDQLVFELLSSGATATATQLDGGTDVDECAAEVVGMLIEVAQTETAHTGAPDCCCDACMRASYAYLNTLAPMAADVNALVIRGEDPTRVSAVLALAVLLFVPDTLIRALARRLPFGWRGLFSVNASNSLV